MSEQPPESARLNALGKPLSPSYDPNYKIKTPLSSINRLRKPMPPGVLRVPMNPDEEQRWKAVKACIAKGDKAKRKAEDSYITAGQHLNALKAEHTGTWFKWEIKLKERAGIGKSRASELMAIADGTKTVEQVRADTAGRTAKTRALQSSPLRSGENAEPEATAEAKKAVERAAEIKIEELKRENADIEGEIEPEAEDVLDLVEEVLDGEPLTAKQTATFEKIKKRLKRRAREDAKREAQNKEALNGYKAGLGPFVAKLMAAGMARELLQALTVRSQCGAYMGCACWLAPPLVEALEEALGVAPGDYIPDENAPPPAEAVDATATDAAASPGSAA
jgi:hypothetical protein